MPSFTDLLESRGITDGSEPKESLLEEEYLVSNHALQSSSKGIKYRKTPYITDKSRATGGKGLAHFNTLVRGFRFGDDWLKVGKRYLPMEIDGCPVLLLFHRQEYEEEVDLTQCASCGRQFGDKERQICGYCGSTRPKVAKGASNKENGDQSAWHAAMQKKAPAPRPRVRKPRQVREPRPVQNLPPLEQGKGAKYQVMFDKMPLHEGPTVKTYILTFISRGTVLELFEWDTSLKWRRTVDVSYSGEVRIGWLPIRHPSRGHAVIASPRAELPSQSQVDAQNNSLMLSAMSVSDPSVGLRFGSNNAFISHMLKQQSAEEGKRFAGPPIEAMFMAIYENNLTDLTMLIDDGLPIDISDEQEGSPLMYAIKLRRADCCVFLLEAGAAVVLQHGNKLADAADSAPVKALVEALSGEDLFDLQSLDVALDELQPGTRQIAELLLDAIAAQKASERKEWEQQNHEVKRREAAVQQAEEWRRSEEERREMDRQQKTEEWWQEQIVQDVSEAEKERVDERKKGEEERRKKHLEEWGELFEVVHERVPVYEEPSNLSLFVGDEMRGQILELHEFDTTRRWRRCQGHAMEGTLSGWIRMTHPVHGEWVRSCDDVSDD
mmetsp:Transcript_35989/g.64692  ORF Transcript_35989/g.64692 Transcript_35989/m.64692 type:complete len:607 (+) Transcript_35989:49-1869(+)